MAFTDYVSQQSLEDIRTGFSNPFLKFQEGVKEGQAEMQQRSLDALKMRTAEADVKVAEEAASDKALAEVSKQRNLKNKESEASIEAANSANATSEQALSTAKRVEAEQIANAEERRRLDTLKVDQAELENKFTNAQISEMNQKIRLGNLQLTEAEVKKNQTNVRLVGKVIPDVQKQMVADPANALNIYNKLREDSIDLGIGDSFPEVPDVKSALSVMEAMRRRAGMMEDMVKDTINDKRANYRAEIAMLEGRGDPASLDRVKSLKQSLALEDKKLEAEINKDNAAAAKDWSDATGNGFGTSLTEMGQIRTWAEKYIENGFPSSDEDGMDDDTKLALNAVIDTTIKIRRDEELPFDQAWNKAFKRHVREDSGMMPSILKFFGRPVDDVLSAKDSGATPTGVPPTGVPPNASAPPTGDEWSLGKPKGAGK